MAKDLIFYKTEEFQGLAEEVAVAFKAFISGERENRLRFKFILARTILDSPAYSKWGKLQGDFLERLVSRIKQELKNKELPALSRSTLYDLIQVFEKYPTLELLEKEIGAWGSWQSALALIGRNQESKTLENTCKNCPIIGHCSKLIK